MKDTRHKSQDTSDRREGTLLWFRQSLRILVIGALCLVPCDLLYANNVSITNVSLAEPDATNGTILVEFDISWSNAWRTNVNHDAIWVFIKYSTDSGSTWAHATLQTAGTDPSGTSTGSGSEIEIVVPTDKVGAFIRPANDGKGDISTTDVQLVWDWNTDGLSASDTASVRVYGIEMVYVPTDSFYLGDGDNTNESSNAFHDGTTNQNVQITTTIVNDIRVDANSHDDAQIENTGIGIDGDGGLDTDDDATVDNADFPTGYSAFYLMKYELSQSQYRDFLNTLTQAQQNNRVESDLSNENDAGTYIMLGEATMLSANRHGLRASTSNPSDGNPYTIGADLDGDSSLDGTVDGEWIAMNYMTWMDLAAYADWAGLRPMTELEYEKAARGPTAAVYQEFAWGSTNITTTNLDTAGSNIDQSATELPYVVAGTGNANYTTVENNLDGPVRVGSFAYAAGSSNFLSVPEIVRETTGSGYYGNMELSGNVIEMMVTVGNSTGRAFDGSHGDGVLSTPSTYEGNATNATWPGLDATSSRGVTGGTGAGIRGGSWNTSSAIARVSDREAAADGSSITTRDNEIGGRLARTAP